VTIDAVIQELCSGLPRAIGAIVCDPDGERIAHAEGRAPAPLSATDRAKAQLPQSMRDRSESLELLLQLAAAEPQAYLRALHDRGRSSGAGDLKTVELQFADVCVLVSPLPEQHYLLLALRRPCVVLDARQALESAGSRLRPLIDR
jgi:hypothetical protein